MSVTGQPGPMIDRRSLLGGAAALLYASSATAMARRPAPFFARHDMPIGIQLYTVAAEAKADLDGTLGALARIGYRTVELAGYIDRSPAELRTALDRAGLRCKSSHIIGKPIRPNTPLTLDQDPGKLAADCHALGCDLIVMPLFNIPDHIPATPLPGEDLATRVGRIGAAMTADDWKVNADYLNGKAAALRRHGIRLGFHNHNIEFFPVAGTTGMDILLRDTDPRLVEFELDIGWAVAAGVDPVALMARHPGRFTAFHVKDVKAPSKTGSAVLLDPAEVGKGIIGWKRVLPAAYKAGVRDFFVEQEPPFTDPPLVSVAKNFTYLSNLVTA